MSTPFPDLGPTARALFALELLQQRGVLNAAELAERLGVSERAARRTITTLREAGVPIEAARGPHGGFRLGKGLRLPPLVFSATEAVGLVMAVLDAGHPAGDPDDPAGAALGKLIDALPRRVGEQAAVLREHARSSPRSTDHRPDAGIITTLVEATAEARRLRIDYRTGSREWVEEVDPWGVVVRHTTWYLVCHSHRVGAVRTYRVDRIRDAEALDQTFDPPPDLDVVALLAQHLATGWRHPVRVRFDAPIDQVRPWVGSSMGTLSVDPHDPARCLLEGSTNNPDGYVAERLAGIPFGFQIQGGDEVRAAMARLIARLQATL